MNLLLIEKYYNISFYDNKKNDKLIIDLKDQCKYRFIPIFIYNFSYNKKIYVKFINRISYTILMYRTSVIS